MKTTRQRASFLSRRGRSTAHLQASRPNSRRLRFESLEDRRMLAVFSVSNLDDAGAGSLREAVDDANNLGGADQIAFVGAATSGLIALTTGEIEITEALTITGPGQASLTIDAQQNSRIFNITASSGDFTFAGLTLTGGRTTGNGFAFNGGAIRSVSFGDLTIDQSTISGNSTAGGLAYGGGIHAAGEVTLTGSTISGNSTAGYYAGGGGIFSERTVTLTNSTVSGNSTAGDYAYGGGISALRDVTLSSSTVSGNSTTGKDADGGGIRSTGDITLTSSTVTANSTTGDGGGIRTPGDVTLTNSTVSGNSAVGYLSSGGGIAATGIITITSSTITENQATGVFNSRGGGILSRGSSLSVTNSIVAGNTSSSFLDPDIDSGTGALDAVYSLLGTSVTPDAGGIGNLFDNNPLLGPLVDNGGPTLPNGAVILTHALLLGSPAIDAGDSAAAPGVLGVPLYDQRGNNFGRVQNGRIDMGAFEVRQTFSADFDQDLDIDGADFLAWQRGFGTAAPDATRADGDADNDGDSDAADLSRWEDQFGQFAGGPLLGVPQGIEFMNPNSDATVDFVLIDVDTSWIGQGEYFFDIQITGNSSVFQHHGTQLVALADTTVFDVDGALTSVIADWTTDILPRTAGEIYTVCIQILRFLGDDGTFELLGEEKCRDFGPF